MKMHDKQLEEQLDKLDKWAAEKLMGWTWVETKYGEYEIPMTYWIDKEGKVISEFWSPTRDLNQALRVDNEMDQLGFGLTIARQKLPHAFLVIYDNGFEASASRKGIRESARASKLAEAIVRAAHKTLGGE